MPPKNAKKPVAKPPTGPGAQPKVEPDVLGGPWDFPTDPQLQQTFFEEISPLSSIEQKHAPFTPLDTLIACTGTICVGTFVLSTVFRWWFSEIKPISKHKLSEILVHTRDMWSQALTQAAQQEKQILQQQPNMTPEDKKQLSDYLRYRIAQQLEQAEGQLLQQANVSREQIHAALTEYSDDKALVKHTQDISKMVLNVIPPPPLPWPWTEDDVMELLELLFTTRLDCIEQVYKAVSQNKPQGQPMSQEALDESAAAYSALLDKELNRIYDSKGVTAQYVQRLVKSIQAGPRYIDALHRFKQEYKQRYSALGFETKRSA